MLDSPFGLDFKRTSPFAEGLTLQNERKSTIDDTWEPVWGTHSRIRNHANELSVTLAETSAPGRKLEFIVRAYDNGIGFRYAIPVQSSIGEFKLISERSEFHFPPERIWESSVDVTSASTLKARMAAGGGYVVQFRKK